MDLNGAKGILKSLADGVDPLTGEVLPEDHICNQPEIIRAIYMVLMELSRGKQHREKPENDGAPWSEEEEQTTLRYVRPKPNNKRNLRLFQTDKWRNSGEVSKVRKDF